MKYIPNFTREMVDNGLLFEINRNVLHPLGLALVVDVHPDNSKWIVISGIASVEEGDEEGFLFDKETFDSGKRKFELYLMRDGQKKLDKRKEKLGFIVQESAEDQDEDI